MQNDKPITKAKPLGETRFPGELRATLHQGRWLLAASEIVVSLFVLARGQAAAPVLLTLGALTLYNLLSILAVRRPVMPRFLVPAMLALDLVFILLGARQTGGAQSPFLFQCYLIILAGALWYDLIGGIAIGLASSLIAITAQYAPFPLDGQHILLLQNLIPSYLLAGGFTGFLVRHLKSYYERDVRAKLSEQASKQEMLLAHDMQKASLPLKPPDVHGLECAFLTRAAGDIGGDFLLFLSPEPEMSSKPLLGIVVGDVAGKGIPAALAATGIAHLLPWLEPLKDPGRALINLNSDLSERLPGEYYATLLFAEVAPEHLCLWTAGHPPALLWRSDQARVVADESVADPPLGLFPQWQGNPKVISWSVGDVLLLYTDGASETRNSKGQQFRADRIGAVLSSCPRAPAAEIVQKIYHAIEKWGTPVDDLTLVVCKRLDSGSRANPAGGDNGDIHGNQ
jgi:sigma-B regulation protein RsbU (phosphoserine phosphatase)